MVTRWRPDGVHQPCPSAGGSCGRKVRHCRPICAGTACAQPSQWWPRCKPVGMPMLHFVGKVMWSWIKRFLGRAAEGKDTPATAVAPVNKPANMPVNKPLMLAQPAVLSEATRRALREGFRSSRSASERSARPLTGIPVTHAPPPPAAQLRHCASAAPPSSVAPSAAVPAARAKAPASAGATAPGEPFLSGAAWNMPPPPPVPGLLDPAATMPTSTPWVMPMGEAQNPSAFGELSGPSTLDLSSLSHVLPLSPPAATPADPPSIDVLGGAPSWASPDVLGRD